MSADIIYNNIIPTTPARTHGMPIFPAAFFEVSTSGELELARADATSNFLISLLRPVPLLGMVDETTVVGKAEETWEVAALVAEAEVMVELESSSSSPNKEPIMESTNPDDVELGVALRLVLVAETALLDPPKKPPIALPRDPPDLVAVVEELV